MAATVAAHVASMGPLLDSSGERERSAVRPLLAPLASRRFNGAAARQQRRGGASRGAMRPRSAWLQWGRCSTAAERPAPPVDLVALDGDASKGPLLDSSGEASRERAAVRDAERLLQWGRCSTAAESRELRRSRCRSPTGASMGPLLDSSGEVRLVATRGAGTELLQWGRCSTAAESRSARPLRDHPAGNASMGPLLDSSGEIESSAVGPTAPGAMRASMGPLLDSSGEAPTDASTLRATARRASMGPLLDSSGEVGPRRASRPARPLQWGRCSTAAESYITGGVALPRGQASMGPLLDSSGEARAARAAGLHRGRFNGAAARQQRRAHRLPPRARARWGFNGAAARQQRRVGAATRGHARRPRSLQWGRCSTAERRGAAGARSSTRCALQWGRCSTAAESAGSALRPGPTKRLQWGRCSTAAERGPAGLAWRGGGHLGASMGPLLDSSGE